MNVLDEWIKAASVELGLGPDDVPRESVLDVARDVAHNVVRPGAPVSAYLMGLAVGRGADPADAAARLSRLALAWNAEADSKATEARNAAADEKGD
ncbi:DUF6457 domain-containing protein [Actinoplanes sp. NPDC051475]|uniref:DUF6457 domain-containing protein n=1 Tax=Actinoplanes sp. NPDC051475 TaxID=3157225 RepID=UPI00344E23C3